MGRKVEVEGVGGKKGLGKGPYPTPVRVDQKPLIDRGTFVIEFLNRALPRWSEVREMDSVN